MKNITVLAIISLILVGCGGSAESHGNNSPATAGDGVRGNIDTSISGTVSRTK